MTAKITQEKKIGALATEYEDTGRRKRKGCVSRLSSMVSFHFFDQKYHAPGSERAGEYGSISF